MIQTAGIQFPIQFRNGRLGMSSGHQHVKEAIKLVLSIAKGEMLLLPEFGSSLQSRIFEPSYVASLAGHAIRNALSRYVPYVTVESVDADMSQAHEGIIMLNVRYRVNETAEQGTINYQLRT